MALISLRSNFPSLNLMMVIALIAHIITYCYGFNLKALNLNESMYGQSYGSESDWSPAGATWYGAANGAGSDGGACGYTNAVDEPPFSGMVSAGGPSIYQNGGGCGVCYEVKCTENENKACSGSAVTVTVTDQCPGCNSEPAHFDLSGTAFGALAKPRQGYLLRNAGVLPIQYRMVNCKYPGVTVVVRVDQGANLYYFAATIEYADGTGIKGVELRQHNGNDWMSMEQSWGAVWKLDGGFELNPPLSLRLTEAQSGTSLVLADIIPVGWQPGRAYRSHVNFNG